MCVALLAGGWLPTASLAGGQPATTQACIPGTTLALGSTQIGMRADSALESLGREISIRRDTVEGADWVFPRI